MCHCQKARNGENKRGHSWRLHFEVCSGQGGPDTVLARYGGAPPARLEVSARKGSQRNQGPSGSSLNPGHTVETRIWITRMNVNPSGPEAPISFCRPNATKDWCHCLDPEPTPSGPCGNLALIILFTSRRQQYSNFDSFHIKYYRSYLECLKGFKREV